MINGLRLSSLIVICALMTACTDSQIAHFEQDETLPVQGKLISVSKVGSYSHLTLRFLFWMQGMAKALPTEHGIELYRVVYGTQAPDGRLVRASGLLALPKTPPPYRGVVSWQHGTASLRNAAPSSLDHFNGLLPAAVFAGHGYVLLAPDYIGYGVSEEPHSYYHTKSMAHAVTDFIAANIALFQQQDVAWPGDLYLAGFSQGAHASLASQRLIESAGTYDFGLRGVASVAGAVDLANVGIASALEGKSKFGSLYIAWIAVSYARDYGLALDSVLKEPWVTIAPDLFDGEHSGDVIVSALPAVPTDMLTDEFITAVKGGYEHPFLSLMRKNELLNWSPVAPVCAYYGDHDVDVTPPQAVLLGKLASTRSKIKIQSVGPLDHESSMIAAAPLLRNWFDGGAVANCGG